MELSPIGLSPPFIFILFFFIGPFYPAYNENQGFSKLKSKQKSKLSLQLSYPSNFSHLLSLTHTAEISTYWFCFPSLNLPLNTWQGLRLQGFPYTWCLLEHPVPFSTSLKSITSKPSPSWDSQRSCAQSNSLLLTFSVSSILSSFPTGTKELSFTHSPQLEIRGAFKQCFLLYICASQVAQW